MTKPDFNFSADQKTYFLTHFLETDLDWYARCCDSALKYMDIYNNSDFSVIKANEIQKHYFPRSLLNLLEIFDENPSRNEEIKDHIVLLKGLYRNLGQHISEIREETKKFIKNKDNSKQK